MAHERNLMRSEGVYSLAPHDARPECSHDIERAVVREDIG